MASVMAGRNGPDVAAVPRSHRAAVLMSPVRSLREIRLTTGTTRGEAAMADATPRASVCDDQSKSKTKP